MEDAPGTKKQRFQDPRHKESTRKEGNEDGVDHISCLPNAILGDIISLLPTMDCARTKCLSTKWSCLWLCAPLNFDYCDLQDPNDDKDLVSIISSIFNAHPGPARRFCIPAHYLWTNIDNLVTWLESDTLNGLQELEFHIPENDFTLSLYPPPPVSIFRFSPTLRIVSFGGCHLPDIMVNQFQFPNLQQLTLFDVIISEETLHALLHGCPALENLLMKKIEGFRCVRINSRSLKSIGVHVDSFRQGPTLEELIIEDAPFLERLISFERFSTLHISVISAPKLETLGCIFENSNNTMLSLGSATFLGIRSVDMGAMVRMHTVKVLSVFPSSLCLVDVLNFIRCFPCLEKLYIQLLSGAQGHTNQRCHEHKNLIESLDLRLKTIVMKNYRGTPEQSEFVTFFVENAKMLESMRFVVPSCFYRDRNWIIRQHREFNLDKSSCRGSATFTFTDNQCHRYMIHVLRASDLSAADPFDCNC